MKKYIFGVILLFVLAFVTGCGCEHEYGAWSTTKQPLCNEKGIEQRICDICGRTEENEIPMSNTHSYNDGIVVKAATCTTIGKLQKTCTVCGVTQEETIPVKDHSFSEWITTTLASCNVNGQMQRSCSDCGIVEEEILPLVEHNFGDFVISKENTCFENGEKVRTCIVCELQSFEAIPAGHSWNDATCTDAMTCQVCGNTSGSPLGHSWKEATYQEPMTCTVCGVTEGAPLVPGIFIGESWAIMNSVGGVKPYIVYRNDSGKSIKYITFTAVPYNAVGDKVSSDIGGKTTASLQVTGPILPAGESFEGVGFTYFVNGVKQNCVCKPDEQYWYLDENFNKQYIPVSEYNKICTYAVWEPIWYNYAIRKIEITGVHIEYMDGTKETIDSPDVMSYTFTN